MNPDLLEAVETQGHVDHLLSDPSFQWFAQRMHNEGLAAIRHIRTTDSDDRAYVAHTTEAQVLMTLPDRLARVRKKAASVITLHSESPTQEDPDEQ